MAKPSSQNLVWVLVLISVAIAEATPPGIANNPSHARCLIKKYKLCYNLEHVCPKFCPDSCTVECVSCKPICSGGSTVPPPDSDQSPSPPEGEKSPPKASPPDDGKGSEKGDNNGKGNDNGNGKGDNNGKGNDDGKGDNNGNGNDNGNGKGDDKGKGDDNNGKGNGDGKGGGDGKGTPGAPTPSPSPPASPPHYSPPPPTTPSQSPSTSPPPQYSPPPTPAQSPPPPTPSSPPTSPPQYPPPPTPTPSPPPPTPSSPPTSPPQYPPPPSTPTTPTPSPPLPTPSSPPTSPPEYPPPPSNPTIPTSPPPTPSSPPTSPPQSPPPPSTPTPSPPLPTPSSPPQYPPPTPTPTTPPPTSQTPPVSPSPPPTYIPPPPNDSSEAAGGKRKRCRDRINYPHCYGIQHVCPSSCPNTCEIDCVTCKPVCKCDMPGAVCQDPRFIGGDGLTFYFHGKKDQDFCLVTDPNLHINAHFIGRRNENMKRDFTWVQSIAILFGNHQIYVGAQKTATWNHAIDRLSVKFDDQSIVLPAAEGSSWQPANLPSATMKRDSDTNSIIIEIDGLLQISVKVVPITQQESKVHNYGITEDDCFAHLELGFKFFSLSENVNGVLGQTYKGNYASRVKMGVAMPVLGGEKEFAVSSLFGADCAVSQFGGGKLQLGGNGLELPGMKCSSGIDGKGVVCKR
ncbi:hypothetical protein CASFOL_036044 [Castilleja foliolosa]|uniref:Uncharacterized protein n=1 Tax=Castilleja foliolosa TaxID=1961234 RepID=A0ABD3BV38_9LAMI